MDGYKQALCSKYTQASVRIYVLATCCACSTKITLLAGWCHLWSKTEQSPGQMDSFTIHFKVNSCLPLVTASRATPQPEAPPPITKTSNSGVFFKALMWTDLAGRVEFGWHITVFSAAMTGENKVFCNKKNAMSLTYSCAPQHLHLIIIFWKEGIGRVRNPDCCARKVRERDP